MRSYWVARGNTVAFESIARAGELERGSPTPKKKIVGTPDGMNDRKQ